ncbi:MAG: ATP-dependent sacrificial sulfur transferase LarE [Deltaproteobacteria bacterium]|nr:ATP-dependent sacrificial sulfur transferase LarE [Deltaproteobacteria bacterium]
MNGASPTSNVELAPETPELDRKLEALQRRLSDCARAIVAYSGGVDSAFLLRVAHDALGDRVLALTARSPSLMKSELEAASDLAKAIGVKHEIIETHELDRAGYVENSIERCYHCKSELFDAASLAVARFPGAVILDGFNADDLRDHRPGHRAAAERSVEHPLAEVGLSKAEIRTLSRRLGLPTWQKAQLACLSSRIPYGTPVTQQRLLRIEAVEGALRGLGFFDVRARLVPSNDDFARIEIGEAELARAVDPEVRAAIVSAARNAGFRFITLDLEGFRSGRMNEGVVDPLVQLPRPG